MCYQRQWQTPISAYSTQTCELVLLGRVSALVNCEIHITPSDASLLMDTNGPWELGSAFLDACCRGVTDGANFPVHWKGLTSVADV
jgi:hypothetical protein